MFAKKNDRFKKINGRRTEVNDFSSDVLKDATGIFTRV